MQVHIPPCCLSDDSLSSEDEFSNLADFATADDGGRRVPQQQSSRSRVMDMGRRVSDMFDEAFRSAGTGTGAVQEQDGAAPKEKPKRGRPRGCKPEPHGADEESEHKLQRWVRDPTATKYWQLLKDPRIADPASYEGKKFRRDRDHHPTTPY